MSSQYKSYDNRGTSHKISTEILPNLMRTQSDLFKSCQSPPGRVALSPWVTQGISSPSLIVGSEPIALFPTCFLPLTFFCELGFLPIWAAWLPNPPTQDSEPRFCLQQCRLFPSFLPAMQMLLYSSSPLPNCSKELKVDLVVFKGHCKFWIPLLLCHLRKLTHPQASVLKKVIVTLGTL